MAEYIEEFMGLFSHIHLKYDVEQIAKFSNGIYLDIQDSTSFQAWALDKAE